jgi:hypothetical protein
MPGLFLCPIIHLDVMKTVTYGSIIISGGAAINQKLRRRMLHTSRIYHSKIAVSPLAGIFLHGSHSTGSRRTATKFTAWLENSVARCGHIVQRHCGKPPNSRIERRVMAAQNEAKMPLFEYSMNYFHPEKVDAHIVSLGVNNIGILY